MISKLIRLTKLIVFKFINLFISPYRNIQEKTLLLIRLDAIGDYILFRNYLKILKKSEKYKNYKITLVGNSVWRNLAEKLDIKYIDKFIWIDRKKFNRNLLYRYKKLKEITLKGYEVVLSPVYSREFFYTDNIIKLVNAKQKIGSIGDLSNIKKWQKKISDRYYTKLIATENKIKFEFYRNKEFFENLLGEKIDIKRPSIDYKQLVETDSDFQLPERFVVLFIGASSKNRKWPIENFAELGKYLKKKHGFEIVLCGAAEDLEGIKRFKKICDEKFINLIGKTSLIDMINIIRKASFLISNETFAPHMSVALDIPVLVIYNGNHFGRFVPYPKEIADNYYVVYHPEIDENLEDYKKLSNTYGYGSNLDIREISLDKVIEKLDRIFAENESELHS